jgi:ABC transport system ATP-binding/permease protein
VVPSLEIHTNTESKKQSYPLTQPIINLGRDPTNEIVIKDPIVSNFHIQIALRDNQLFLIHPHPARERTSIGLMYQGRQITGEELFDKQLVHGDIFRIGDENSTLITLTYADSTRTSTEMSPSIQPIPLNGQRLTIGRTPDNTVVLNHQQVSRQHALLEKVNNGYLIIDKNSTNHVFINNTRVINQRLLRTGDEIRIGPYQLIYTGVELQPYDESNYIGIKALHLNRRGIYGITLLNDISLVIPPRKFVALVGGSGAGKSTLMDALNGLHPAQTGTVLYNNVDYYHNLAAFSTQLGYVPQGDIVHRELTVERALLYAARLRLPSDFTTEQIQWRIDEVLEDVELTERRKLRVSKLSGGQRKRVSIALEFLTDPSVIFLDEPTSGLDPGLDRKMMYLLRQLADRGRTIILVTHATNNIMACDYVCFLAQGGRLAYFGPPEEARTYFHKTDFAEIYNALEPTREHLNIPNEAEEAFLASKDYQQYVAQPLRNRPTGQQTTQPETTKTVQHINAFKQFRLLSTRYLEQLKNSGNLLFLLLQAPVVGLILLLIISSVGGRVFDPSNVVQCQNVTTTPIVPMNCSEIKSFLENTPQGRSYAQNHGGEQEASQNFIINGSGGNAQLALSIITFITIFFGYLNASREIVRESSIYLRERTGQYIQIVPYILSKFVVLGTLCLFQTAILLLIVDAGVPFQNGIFLPALLEVYITLVLTSFASLMGGLMISAIAQYYEQVVSFLLIIFIPQIIFSGIIFPLKGIFLQALSIFSLARWTIVALGSSVGLHADKLNGTTLFGNDFAYHGTLFSLYDQGDATRHLLLMWLALGIIFITQGLAVAYFLKRKEILLKR